MIKVCSCKVQVCLLYLLAQEMTLALPIYLSMIYLSNVKIGASTLIYLKNPKSPKIESPKNPLLVLTSKMHSLMVFPRSSIGTNPNMMMAQVQTSLNGCNRTSCMFIILNQQTPSFPFTTRRNGNM